AVQPELSRSASPAKLLSQDDKRKAVTQPSAVMAGDGLVLNRRGRSCFGCEGMLECPVGLCPESCRTDEDCRSDAMYVNLACLPDGGPAAMCWASPRSLLQ